MGQVATVHARHIFDWDSFRAGQYFYMSTTNLTGIGSAGAPSMFVITYFPNASLADVENVLKPFVADLMETGASVSQTIQQVNINDALFTADDIVGSNLVMGSRLIPAKTYQTDPDLVGQVYTDLMEAGAAE